MGCGDDGCARFLQWALPALGLRWRGFRRPRRQVCRRLRRRIGELALRDLDAYRAYLSAHRDEWPVLDGLCRVTISRFFRDRRLFDALPVALAALARAAAAAGRDRLRCWSAGCASGEEPYSVVLAWSFGPPCGLPLEVVATDADAHMLSRARSATYPRGTLRELDERVISLAFEHEGERYRLRERERARVTFLQQDLRLRAPEGRFDLVLCRNLAFSYFSSEVQREVVARLAEHLHEGGLLVVGAHEQLPEDGAPWFLPSAEVPYGWRRGGEGWDRPPHS